jgi:hypothetical protein
VGATCANREDSNEKNERSRKERNQLERIHPRLEGQAEHMLQLRATEDSAGNGGAQGLTST